jgi:hypothetical protein
MVTVAAHIDSTLSGKATVGTANLGYNTVIEPASGALSFKYTYVTATQLTHARIVYELGPRKQDGGPGQVYSTLGFGRLDAGCFAVITHAPTWAVPAYRDEMHRASVDFWGIGP